MVVDAISACRRMGSDQAAFEFVMRLINACKESGITILLVNQAAGFTEEQEISGIGLSSIMDAVICLRHIDVGGELNRILLVMKSRGSKHSNQLREFIITDDGIDIVDVYVGEGGVLTGVARHEQEAKEEAERVLKQQQIELKEREVARQRATMEAEAIRSQATLAAAETELEQLRLAQSVLTEERNVRAELRDEDADSSRLKSSPRRGKKRTRGKGGSK
jgi:circadian clock protein KaiC